MSETNEDGIAKSVQTAIEMSEQQPLYKSNIKSKESAEQLDQIGEVTNKEDNSVISSATQDKDINAEEEINNGSDHDEKMKNNEEKEETDDNVETETLYKKCCCDGCCIKKRIVKKKYLRKSRQDDRDRNKVVARLNDDIWALGYVIARNRKKLPCSYIILLYTIYSVQASIICGMIWSYSEMLNQDVVSQYKMDGRCGFLYEYNYTESDNYTEYDNYTDYVNYTNYTEYYDDMIITDNSQIDGHAQITCDSVNLIEGNARTQTWDGLDDDFEDDYMGLMTMVKTKGHVLVFPFVATLSFMLLVFYIGSAMTNPTIMFIIAHEYNQNKPIKDIVEHPCYDCIQRRGDYDALCMCTKGCSSISCQLYTMAWLNTFLCMAAFATGFVVLFSYPFYFGIDSPIEIILTPIGLVFILEIDNWVFDMAKQCYPETQTEELWTFKGRCFRDPEKPYTKRISDIGSAIFLLYFLITFILVVCTLANILTDFDDDTSMISFNAVSLGYMTICSAISVMGTLAGISSTRCECYEVVYDDEGLEPIDETIERAKELSVRDEEDVDEMKELSLGDEK